MFGLDWGLRILHLADQEKVVEELQECEDEGQILLAVDKVPIMDIQVKPHHLYCHHITFARRTQYLWNNHLNMHIKEGLDDLRWEDSIMMILGGRIP